MSSWGIRMELLRIVTRDIAHSTRGGILSGRISTFSGYLTSGIPSAVISPSPDISHPDGRGGRFNFPGQTCPDPLIGYFISGYLIAGWERRTFQLPRSDMSGYSKSAYPESIRSRQFRFPGQPFLHSATKFLLKLPNISDRHPEIFYFKYLLSKSPKSPCNPLIIGFLSL